MAEPTSRSATEVGQVDYSCTIGAEIYIDSPNFTDVVCMTDPSSRLQKQEGRVNATRQPF